MPVASQMQSDGCRIAPIYERENLVFLRDSLTLASPDPKLITIATAIHRVAPYPTKVPHRSPVPRRSSAPRLVGQASTGCVDQDLISSVVVSKWTGRMWPLAVRTTAMPRLKSSATI